MSSSIILCTCAYLLLSISSAVTQLSYTTLSPAPSSVTCNDVTGCEITCSGDSSCNGATINSQFASYLTITASGLAALRSTTIHCPSNAECTVITSGKNALRSATINCGKNGVCDIKGGDEKALFMTHINATSSTKLTITADGGYLALAEADIYCPRNQAAASCIIRLRSDSSPYWSSSVGGPIMEFVYFYIDSADDVEFQCDANTNWDALFSTIVYNEIHSYIDGAAICNIEVASYSANDFFGTNIFECMYKEKGTNYNLLNKKSCVRWPTDSPTDLPTNLPSNTPTKLPTIKPSLAPTKLPTKYPTNFPTLTPTKSPTNEPTLSPTKYPTISPTNLLSLAPTKAPSKTPTKAPSKTPTKSPETELIVIVNMPSSAPTSDIVITYQSIVEQENEDSNVYNDDELKINSSILLGIIGCGIVCVAACIIFVLKCLYKQNKHKQYKNSVNNINPIKPKQNNKQIKVTEITEKEAQIGDNRVESITVDEYIETQNDDERVMNEVMNTMNDATNGDFDEEKMEIEEHQDAEESLTNVTNMSRQNSANMIRQNSNNTFVRRDLLLLENIMETKDGILKEDEFEVRSDSSSAHEVIETDDITEEGPDDVVTVEEIQENAETVGSRTKC